MRVRKPCVLARRRLFGWKVRFGIVFFSYLEGKPRLYNTKVSMKVLVSARRPARIGLHDCRLAVSLAVHRKSNRVSTGRHHLSASPAATTPAAATASSPASAAGRRRRNRAGTGIGRSRSGRRAAAKPATSAATPSGSAQSESVHTRRGGRRLRRRLPIRLNIQRFGIHRPHRRIAGRAGTHRARRIHQFQLQRFRRRRLQVVIDEHARRADSSPAAPHAAAAYRSCRPREPRSSRPV